MSNGHVTAVCSAVRSLFPIANNVRMRKMSTSVECRRGGVSTSVKRRISVLAAKTAVEGNAALEGPPMSATVQNGRGNVIEFSGPPPADFADRMKAIGARYDEKRRQEARAAWAAEWTATQTAFFRRRVEERSSAEYERLWDETAARFRGACIGPREANPAAQAFAVERVITRWRREMERSLLFGVRHTGIDPETDTTSIQAHVARLHRELIEDLRLHHYADRLSRYEALDDRTKRRWRVALMRFADLCATNGWPHFPQDIKSLEDYPDDADGDSDFELSLAVEQLPFLGIRDFDGELFEELLAVWKDGAGTKREGARSKWLVLEELLLAVWKDKTGHRQLKKDWIAAQRRNRNSPTKK